MSMQGQRILITGGNSGIGLVAATELARQGAELVLACRDSEKTAAALTQINNVAAVPAVNLPVDLASLASVRQLADTVLERYDGLDVLINNAGLFPPKGKLTEDGFEMQIGVNHLAHFLLTNLVLDRLKARPAARIVNVSSMLHKKGAIDFDSFQTTDGYNAQKAYGQSKLANLLFSNELARRLQDTAVTSNALHPGAVATDIVRDTPWLIRKVIGLMFIAPEKGAKTTIMLASDPQLSQVSGKYYNQCELEEPAPQALDSELQKRLWETSAAATGLTSTI